VVWHTSRHAMEKLVTALLVWPWNEHVTVAVPPVPDDCMCQVHPTTPLLPTVCADPSNDRGASPVEIDDTGHADRAHGRPGVRRQCHPACRLTFASSTGLDRAPHAHLPSSIERGKIAQRVEAIAAAVLYDRSGAIRLA
jgi:hypothetical protein